MTRRALVTVLILSSALATPASVRATAATSTCFATSTSSTLNQSASRRPAIFVHGWNVAHSNLGTMSTVLTDQTNHEITPFLFDYGSHSDIWAAAPVVSGCLADYITAVSSAYQAVGGDGGVLIVGHSMGGLAALYASVQPGVGKRIAGLITFDTPFAGSPFGDRAVAGALELYQQVVHRLAVPPEGSDAQVCLGLHDRGAPLPSGCAYGLPPYLAASTPIHEIAGDITLRRDLLGIHLYDIHFGSDAIVPASSSSAYVTAGPTGARPPGAHVSISTDACTVTTDAVGDFVRAANSTGRIRDLFASGAGSLYSDSHVIDDILAGHMTLPLAVYSLVLENVAPCSHGHIINDQSAWNQATEAMKADLAARAPIDANALLSAPVPSTCRHPAGRLVNGSQPNLPPNSGETSLSWVGDPEEQHSRLVFGDLNGDGAIDAATTLDCNAGGIGWPETLVFYGPGPTLLGSLTLDKADLPGNNDGEHDTVYKLQFENGAVLATWATEQDGDVDAAATIDYSATFRLGNGGTLIASNVKATNEVPALNQFLSDVRGRRTVPASLAAPSVVQEAAQLMQFYPAARSAASKCYGTIDLSLPGPVQPLVETGGNEYLPADRLCILQTNPSEPPGYIVLGMTHTGYLSWQVSWVRTV